MSVARPARSLLGRCLASSKTTSPALAASSRSLHTSAARSNRKPRFRNVKAEDLGLVKADRTVQKDKMEQYQKDVFPEYSAEDKAKLRAKYTPEQLEALEAGERAVDTQDIILQGRFRDDAYAPDYIEDYSVLDPRYDLKPQVESIPQEVTWPDRSEWLDNYGQKMGRIMDKKTSDQLTRAMVRAMRRVKESTGEDLIDLTHDELRDMEADPELARRYVLPEEGEEGKDKDVAEAEEGADLGPEFMTRSQALKLDDAVNAEWKKELDKLAEFSHQDEVAPSNLELMRDGPAGIDGAHMAEAAELGKVPGVAGMYKHAADPEDQGQDDAGKFQEIKRLTGMSLKEIRSLLTKSLVTRWVSNQTRLGKVRSTSVVAIAGNGNGRLGIGMAKSTEPGVADETAQMLAIRNMRPIRRYENRTIFGNVSAKVSGTIVELKSRPPGESGIHTLPTKQHTDLTF